MPADSRGMRLAFALVVASGCATVTVDDFEIEQPIEAQQVEGSPLPGPLASAFPLAVNLDLSQKVKAMNTGPVDAITLTAIELDITATDRPAGDTDDWSFLTSVDLYVKPTAENSSLPRTKIATVKKPGAVTTLVFTVDESVNLAPYIEAGATVDSTASGTAPPDDVSFAGSSTFTVHPGTTSL